MAARSAATGQAAGNGTPPSNTTVSGPRIANPYRAYPPSCAADPLPDTPTGPTYSDAGAALHARHANGDRGHARRRDDHALAHGLQQQRQPAPYNTDSGRTRCC